MIASLYMLERKILSKRWKNNKDRCRLGETVMPTDSKGQRAQLASYLTYWTKNYMFNYMSPTANLE